MSVISEQKNNKISKKGIVLGRFSAIVPNCRGQCRVKWAGRDSRILANGGPVPASAAHNTLWSFLSPTVLRQRKNVGM